jgi:hypothetical protein
MADVFISPDALALAQKLIAEEAMSRPILSVGWSKGQMQNSRGENGEVLWTRTQAPGWYASLSDWAEIGGGEEMEGSIQSGLEKLCVLIDGLTVLVAPDVRSATGTFTVAVSEGVLTLVPGDA